MGDERKIPLADVIQDLRAEIVQAMDALETAPGGDQLRFRLENIELELQVAVTRAGEGKTKAKFWVLEFEAGGQVSRAET